jgi:hypothetical protein
MPRPNILRTAGITPKPTTEEKRIPLPVCCKFVTIKGSNETYMG